MTRLKRRVLDKVVQQQGSRAPSKRWQQLCEEIAGPDEVLREYLLQADISVLTKILREMSRLTSSVPAGSFVEYEEYCARLQETLNQEQEGLKQDRQQQQLLADFGLKTRGDIADIRQWVEGVQRLTPLIDTSKRQLLDRGYQSWPDAQTQAAWTLAELLARSPRSAYFTSLLSDQGVQGFAQEFMRIYAQRQTLEDSAHSLAQRLQLPEESGEDGSGRAVGSLYSLQGLMARWEDLKEAQAQPHTLLELTGLRKSAETLRGYGLGALVDWLISSQDVFEVSRIESVVQALIAQSMVDEVYVLHREVLENYDGAYLSRITSEIAAMDREYVLKSQKMIRQKLIQQANPPEGRGIGKQSLFTEMSLIRSEISRRDKIGVHELTKRAGKALLELTPCWMMSPVAVARYLYCDLVFDLVIIDEASQMPPENAIGAIRRAHRVVIVGDTKQLPPTSFFVSQSGDDFVDEDVKTDSASILEMANRVFAPKRRLQWHYRSQHSALIHFSNEYIYQGRLMIFPSAREVHEGDYGVKLVHTHGVYAMAKGTNLEEAQQVVAAVRDHMKQSLQMSLGVCAMNHKQSELIFDLLEQLRGQDREVERYIQYWDQKDDGIERFFINNLESIQGEERDVMFISTVYGPVKKHGTVAQRFGPINYKYGHRRLNVLFTRAKRKMVTFTSMSAGDILDVGNKNQGVLVLRKWLEYCENLSHDAQTCEESQQASQGFEHFVAQEIKALGFDVVHRVGVGVFRVDLGVKHPDWPHGYILGIKTDGITYHSSRSYRDRERLSEQVLKSLGWKLYRIWSIDWYLRPQTEIRRLREKIHRTFEELELELSAAQMENNASSDSTHPPVDSETSLQRPKEYPPLRAVEDPQEAQQSTPKPSAWRNNMSAQTPAPSSPPTAPRASRRPPPQQSPPRAEVHPDVAVPVDISGMLHSTASSQGGLESHFEEQVADAIEILGDYEVVPQVGVLGYRIDIGVKHPSCPQGYILAVECDGDSFHRGRDKRLQDRHRQKMLSEHGWCFHRISSGRWFSAKTKPYEMKRLEESLKEALQRVRQHLSDGMTSQRGA